MKRESLATVFFFSLREWKGFLSFFLSFFLLLPLLPLSFSAHVSSESTGVYQFVHPRADPNVAIVSCRHICTMNVMVLLKKRERERVREREKYSRLLLLLLRQSPFSLRWTTMISRSTTYTSVLYMYIQVNKYIGVEARNNTRMYIWTHVRTLTLFRMEQRNPWKRNLDILVISDRGSIIMSVCRRALCRAALFIAFCCYFV